MASIIYLARMEATRPPRLLVLNQYYWPGVEATAHLLTELCEALAADYDVTVVTGRSAAARRAPRSGPERRRVRTRPLDRVRPVEARRRAANYITYLGRSPARAPRPRPDVVLCMTDPPMVGDIALVVARRYGAPLVVSARTSSPRSRSS